MIHVIVVTDNSGATRHYNTDFNDVRVRSMRTILDELMDNGDIESYDIISDIAPTMYNSLGDLIHVVTGELG